MMNHKILAGSNALAVSKALHEAAKKLDIPKLEAALGEVTNFEQLLVTDSGGNTPLLQLLYSKPGMDVIQAYQKWQTQLEASVSEFSPVVDKTLLKAFELILERASELGDSDQILGLVDHKNTLDVSLGEYQALFGPKLDTIIMFVKASAGSSSGWEQYEELFTPDPKSFMIRGKAYDVEKEESTNSESSSKKSGSNFDWAALGRWTLNALYLAAILGILHSIAGWSESEQKG